MTLVLPKAETSQPASAFPLPKTESVSVNNQTEEANSILNEKDIREMYHEAAQFVERVSLPFHYIYGMVILQHPHESQHIFADAILVFTEVLPGFSDKASIHMLCLPKIENTTPEDRDSGLYQWAKLFKATTWKELIDLSENNKVIESTVVTIAKLSNEERIRQQCERHEKYERDRINAMNYSYKKGHDEGHDAGFKEGHASGVSEGRDLEFQLLSKLNQKLLEANRGNEITLVLGDANYRDKLFKEFGLI